MIQVYGIDGSTLYEVLVTAPCEKVEELMVSDHIKLSWNSRTGNAIPAGAYIIHNNERYTLIEPYEPRQKSEAAWLYEPEFQSSVMAWQKVPFFMYTPIYGKDGKIEGYKRETDWTLTSGPMTFMQRIALGIKMETGVEYEVAVGTDVTGSFNVSFSSIDIFSALNSIADAFETEWWVDKENHVIHLSKCKRNNTAVTLEVGQNIHVPSVSLNSEGFYNRFYVFGSTRNIVQSYSGAGVNNLVNKRLTLNPEKYPDGYYEPIPITQGHPVFSKILVFEDIYPAATAFEIYDVVSRLDYVKDEVGNRIQIGTDSDGNPVYDMFAVYYFKIGTPLDGGGHTQYFLNDWEYSENPERQGGDKPGLQGQLIPGLTLSANFTSGSLLGREFELRYVNKNELITTPEGTPVTLTPGYFEIQYTKDDNYIIPDLGTLIPGDGDKAILFNIRMPEEYVGDAYERLETKMLEEIEDKYSTDHNSYTAASKPVAFDTSNPNLKIGTTVNYINGGYVLETRVTKLITKIDRPVVQTITIGNSMVKGSLQELKEEVTNANKNIDLIAALNAATKTIADSYSRTQQVIINNLAKVSDLFELDTTTIPGKAIIKAKHDGFYSDGFISANGASMGTGGGSGASALYELNDVNNNGSAVTRLDGSPAQNGDVFVYSTSVNKWYAIPQSSISPDLTDYATKVWVNAQGFLKEHQSLAEYAKTAWVTSQLLNYMAKADLLDNGVIKSSLLPSFVDDVIEADSKSAFPATGESGKIYVAKDTNKTYRWGGSGYVEISESLALGETSGTAYEGSKGKANADAIAAIQQTLASGVVSSVGGKTGAITLRGGQTANGSVNLTITSAKQLQAAIVGLQALAFKASLAFSELTGKPTTLSGYGITDAYTKSGADAAFLGKTAKASDSDKLDGHDSSYFQEALTQAQLNALQFFSVVTVNGQLCLKLNPEYAGLFAEGFLSANGASMGNGGGGGASALYELNDVLSNGSAITRADGTPVQSGDVFVYNTTLNKWVAYPQSSISPDLSPYALKSWVEAYHDSSKQDVISDLATIRSGAAQGATAVQPEAGKGLFSGSYNDLTHKPTTMPNPNALSFGSKTYDGSSAKEITKSDLGLGNVENKSAAQILAGLTEQNIYALLSSARKNALDSGATQVLIRQITTNAGNITSLGGRLGTAEGDINSLEERVDTAEDNIGNAEADIESLKTLLQGVTVADVEQILKVAWLFGYDPAKNMVYVRNDGGAPGAPADRGLFAYGAVSAGGASPNSGGGGGESEGIPHVFLTEAEYEALEIKDPGTLYFTYEEE